MMKAARYIAIVGLVLGIIVIALTFGSHWAGQRKAAGRPLSADAQAARTCIDTLIDIDYAKQAWARNYQKDSNAIPTWGDLAPYLHLDHPGGFTPPTCPSGGAYTIGCVGDLPTCSVPKHSILLARLAVHVGDEGAEGGDDEKYYDPDDKRAKLRPAGSIVGAKVVVLDEAGHRTKLETGLRGTAIADTWPDRAIAVIVSMRGFLTSSNPVTVDALRAGMTVRLQKARN